MSIFNVKTKQLYTAIKRMVKLNYPDAAYISAELDDTGGSWDNRFDVWDKERNRLGDVKDVVGIFYKISEDISDNWRNIEEDADWDSIDHESWDWVSEDTNGYTLIFNIKDDTYRIDCDYSAEGTEDSTEETYVGNKEDVDEENGFSEHEYKPFVKEVIDKMKQDGCQWVTYVTVAGGDSGYIDAVPHDEQPSGTAKSLDDFSPAVMDGMYELLNQYGGWEINEGSNSEFHFNADGPFLTFSFAWRTSETLTAKGMSKSIFE